jgi:hypothetical protein
MMIADMFPCPEAKNAWQVTFDTSKLWAGAVNMMSPTARAALGLNRIDALPVMLYFLSG